MKKNLNIIFINIASLLFVIAIFELLLPFFGYHKHRAIVYNIKSEPQNAFISDKQYGIKACPGKFNITINGTLSYTATHNNKNQRIIYAYPEKSEIQDGNNIFFTGCSYTYGMGVDDSLTYPYIVSKELNRCRFQNLGNPGYGTIHTYLQLKDILTNASAEKPNIIIYNYLSFHDIRNSLNSNYKTSIIDGYKANTNKYFDTNDGQYFPSAELVNNEINVKYYSIKHLQNMEFPWIRYSAIANSLSKMGAIKTIKKCRQITFALIHEINKLCKENNILFCISIMQPQVLKDREFMNFMTGEDISYIDVSIDFSDKSNFNYPEDPFHPSPKGHSIVAEKIIRFLKNQ